MRPSTASQCRTILLPFLRVAKEASDRTVATLRRQFPAEAYQAGAASHRGLKDGWNSGIDHLHARAKAPDAPDVSWRWRCDKPLHEQEVPRRDGDVRGERGEVDCARPAGAVGIEEQEAVRRVVGDM